jgi:hypothetical protein
MDAVGTWLLNIHSSGLFFGRINANWLPLPNSLVAVKRPPWASTMRRARESPNPVPFPFVVKNGRNMFGSTSGGMPFPLSLTVVVTV